MATEAVSQCGPTQARKARSHPVDLAHLSRYTQGDRALEQEVLELFCAQSTIYLERLREASSDREWTDTAHLLKGSALAIGAWRAAAAAERAEAYLRTVGSKGRDASLRALETSVEEAKAYINTACIKSQL